MATERGMVSREVKCPNKDCGQTFTVERVGMFNRPIKDKCPFCKTKVTVNP